jgi:hypothetical protein
MARSILAILLLLLLGPATPASARDLFSAGISIGGGTPGSAGTNRLRDLPDLFSTSTLTRIDPGYDLSQAVGARVDIRGLTARINFDALSNELRFQVPGADIDVTFDSTSRDGALRDLEEWLEGEFGSSSAPNSAATRFMQALVAESPVDPVAGNPNSLQSRMFDADFRMGTTGAVQSYGEGGILPSLASVKLGGGYANAGGFDQTTIDVPIGFRFGLGEMFAVAVDLPLAATSTQGAWTLLGSGALGLAVSPVRYWTLTPAIRVGGVGSVDLGGLAAMYSGTLTSHVRIPWGPFAFGIGNMGGVARTIDDIEISGYSLTYDLQNWNLRNGVYAEMAFGSELLGTGLAARLLVNDARFFGDELWLDSYQEIGAALAGGLPFGGFQVGLSYLVGKDYDGVKALVGLRF